MKIIKSALDCKSKAKTTSEKAAKPIPKLPIGIDAIMVAKKTEKEPPKGGLHVRPGTMAICVWATGDAAAGTLMHGLIELWVELRKKVEREHEGKKREYVFLSRTELETLTGLTKKQLYDRAIPRLKESLFFTIERGRVSPDAPNKYQIHFDAEAFFGEVEARLKPYTTVTTDLDGFTFTEKIIDRSALPYHFKRLFDGLISTGAKLPV